MGRHASRPPAHRSVRPRYSRISTLLVSVATTAVAVLGASGVLPSGQVAAEASAATPENASVRAGSASNIRTTDPRGATAQVSETALPDSSGEGRRVVFDMSAQRVWLVDAKEKVQRTYLVSGSLTDNLEPGEYAVYSRSLDAVGIDDSGTMRYMVRFAHGENAAIGFHDIPVDAGELVQTRDQLGTPQSHGCIRQWRPDARALWRFAPVGTPVVVVD